MVESVLLTGSSGTIGTALGVRLLEDGYEVVGVDRRPNQWSAALDNRTTIGNLREQTTFEKLPTDVDVIVHLAANSRVRDSIEHPSLGAENLQITQQVLEFARANDLPLVFSSSREVYGDSATEEHDESVVGISNVANPYGASKAGDEAMIQAYRRCYGLEATILRFTNVYGRYDRSDRVIPRFIQQALDDKPLTVYGREKVLDFVHVDDIVDAIEATIDRLGRVDGSVINVGSGTGMSLLEVANLIIEVTDSDSSITIEANRTGEVEAFVANIDRARELLGYEPRVQPKDGFERLLSWHLAEDVEIPR